MYIMYNRTPRTSLRRVPGGTFFYGNKEGDDI